jgi:hypothetical protein
MLPLLDLLLHLAAIVLTVGLNAEILLYAPGSCENGRGFHHETKKSRAISVQSGDEYRHN